MEENKELLYQSDGGKAKLKTKHIVMTIVAFFAIFLAYLFIFGNTYEYKIPCDDGITAEDVKVDLSDQDIIEVQDIKVEKSFVKIKLKAKAKGNTAISVTVGDNQNYTEFFVNSFNVITKDEYIGDFNGVFLLEIESTIILLMLFIFSIYNVRQKRKTSRYSYYMVNETGLALFIGYTLVTMFIIIFIFKRTDFTDILSTILSLFSNFTFVGFPLMMILSLILVVSNICLIKHEGKRLTHLLGVGLGFGIILGTVLVIYAYNILSTFMNVHSYEGHCISLYIENFTSVFLCYFECLIVSTVFYSIKAGRYEPTYDKDFIIILGAGLRKDGTVTPLLAGRADRALEFAQAQESATGKKITFVPSGGKGSDEINAEAQAIKIYLLSKGIDEQQIITEDQSTTTFENMKFSKKIIDSVKDNAKVVFSTTNYHVFRSGVIAENVGLFADGVGSKTKMYYYINALIREFIANLNNERKKHIINGLIIFAVITLLHIFNYLSNAL